MTEAGLREEICRVGKSLYDRGLTFGSAGNISARVAAGTGRDTLGTLGPKLAPAPETFCGSPRVSRVHP